MNTYTKIFKETYSFSRELQILTDLNQKLINVPRVISANNQALSITMSNAGIPINTFIRSSRVDLPQLKQLMYECIDTAYLTAKAGVYHLDLAPRNFLVSAQFRSAPLTARAVKLIDFSVSVSRNFPLQKPLWLKPDSRIHHPALIKALKADWESFFYTINQEPPNNFESDFSINQSDYRKYWATQFEVELIDLNDVVLSFGLHRCMQELLNCWDGLMPDVKLLRRVLEPLQFCKSNQEAVFAIQECLANLNASDEFNRAVATPTPLTNLDSTPVPKLLGSNNLRRTAANPTTPWEHGQSKNMDTKYRLLFYPVLRVLFLLIPSLLSFFIQDIAYKALNIPLDILGLYMVILSVVALFILMFLTLSPNTSKHSIAAFFVIANMSHLPLIFEVLSVEVSRAGQLVSALPIAIGTLLGLGIIYRQS